MLPGPGIFFLVTLESIGARDEQAPAPIRPQARIDLVHDAGTGLGGEEVHETPHETQHEAERETEHTRLLHFDEPIDIVINGRRGFAVVMKPGRVAAVREG